MKAGGNTNKEGDAEQGEQQEDQPPNPVPRREALLSKGKATTLNTPSGALLGKGVD